MAQTAAGRPGSTAVTLEGMGIPPHLAAHDVGLVSYTATRWRFLLRRSRHWPKDKPIPTAGQAYRFVLSNPHVDVCLTAPRSEKELLQNLAAARSGPLADDEMAFLRQAGRGHRTHVAQTENRDIHVSSHFLFRLV